MSDGPASGRMLALLQAGRFGEAIVLLERARGSLEDGPGLRCNLAGAYLAAGRPFDALECLRSVVDEAPGFFLAHGNLATVLIELRRYDEAVQSAERAIALQPAYLGARHNLARAQDAAGHFAAAAAAWAEMLRLAPGNPAAEIGLGNALVQLGRADDGIARLAAHVESPGVTETTRSAYLMALNYSVRLDARAIRTEHLRIGALFAQPAAARRRTPRESGGRIRVGYLSPDFRAHSVAFFFSPLLARHDRSRFEVHCYHANAFSDETTRRLRAQSEHWVEAGAMTDDALALRIAEDGIDVLVDLAGHTAGGRPGVFARRAATAQVAWLGYPTAAGIPGLEERITDALVDPPGPVEGAERVWRLPRSYFCYGTPTDAPEPAPLPALRSGTVTFGSFNNLAKLSDTTLAAWSRVLQAVAGSRLLLKARQLGEPRAAELLAARLAAAGIAPQRVTLQAWKSREDEHLAAYGQVDVALDTFPYNGATTTCEALWMGVPVVSLAGERHVSRMGLSILSAAGHGDWCAKDTEGYCNIARSLAADTAALAKLRAGMRAQLQTSQLLDSAAFTAAFEGLLETLFASGGA